MSAKWRRNKKHSKKFNFLKAFNRAKENNTPHVFRLRGSGTRNQKNSYRYRIPKSYGTGKLKEPEPLIDVFEERDEIVVVAEFAGFSRENLRIDVKNQKLILSAQASDRKYYKSLNLPNRVISETLRLTHKNGVLEIRIKKVAEEKAIDKVAG